MSLDAMAASDLCSLSEAISVDYIVWSVVALLRDGFAENLLGLPEPSALGQKGWYVEPVFAKSERYWDGDWTTRCRLPGAREEVSVAI